MRGFTNGTASAANASRAKVMRGVAKRQQEGGGSGTLTPVTGAKKQCSVTGFRLKGVIYSACSCGSIKGEGCGKLYRIGAKQRDSMRRFVNNTQRGDRNLDTPREVYIC